MVKLKKNSKILLLLVAIVSLFGFSMIFASDEPGKITISKSATKIYDDAGDDNLKKGRNAKVTLTVNGNPYTTSQTSMSKLDIVLVLDNSGSMAYGSRGKNDNSTPSRIASLESTANDFINTMLDKDGNVQIGLVTFSKDVNTSVSFSNYSKKNDLTTAINGMKAYGGTNLQAGIEKAHDLLEDGGRNDAKKMVIILTDGIPTYFNTKYFNTNGRSIKITCGDGSYDKASKWDTSGSYLCPDPDKTPSAAAEQELDDLKKDYSTADIYTITFGEEEEAASKLEKINPVEANENHTYKNEKALDANQLKKLFENISQSLKNVLATNGVVTDTIPSDFSLTDAAKNNLEAKGIEVTENDDGTTTLKWNIGDISAENELSLTYEVRAKEEYHGSMYTNTKAVLTAKASDDNPFYENKDLSLEFEEPSVEIPAITKDDHYKDNSSYKGYSGGTINGTSILNNDLNKHIERESKEDVSVTDKIVIVKNNNVKRIADIADNKYEIYKDSSLQGTLTINEDGTFTFNSSVDTIGEVSFDYYIESDITNPHETKDVESNTSTVTLLINERQKMSINGEKIWEDDNNNDGLRPKSVNVNLYADNEVIRTIDVAKSSDWKYSFNDLYVYRVGHENEESEKIVYRVAETQSYNGYSSSVDGYNITNKHEIEKTEVSGTKTWEDNNNQDGKRPESITINLLANGKKVSSTTATAASNWKYSFTGLNKYENGKEISYTITEDPVENYNTKISGYDITNTHTPQTIDINGKKIWNDSNNQDGKRPSSVTIQLYADGEKVEGQTATISGEGNNWDYSFKNLPMYKAGEIGHEINYSVQEVNVDSNYNVQYDEKNKFNITNTHENEKITVSGTKTWDDYNNQDGIRPSSVTIQLYADGEKVEGKTATISGKGNNWNYSFTNLDKYSKGKEIAYTVKEDEVTGYTTKISGYDITNTHTPEKISIEGTKTWNDSNNQDGKRPESITINLLANGKKVSSTTATVASNWKYSFDNLDKYNQGTEIKYTLEEISVDGYTSEITDFNITNTHTPETVSYILQKAWSDQDNNDAIRPEYIIVRLYADGYEKLSQKVTAESGWTYTFENLPKYNNGKLINYTFTEDVVKGYDSSITINDNSNSNQTIDNDQIADNNKNDSNKSENIKNVTITNTHENEKNNITITKEWNDSGNVYNKRPDSIKVTIVGKVNGQIIVQKDIEITKNMNWLYITKDLDKYYKGQEIKYEIIEDEVDGYTTTYDDYNIINTYIKPAIGETSGEITPPNTGVETSNNNSLIIMLLILVSSFRFVLLKD